MTVNGIPAQAVVDTGAQTTVISVELYRSLLGNSPSNLHNTTTTNNNTFYLQSAFLWLLLTYQALFAKSDSELGYMSAITHKTDAGSATPVGQPVTSSPL